MKEKFRKALLENYLELFIEKKKESEMLIASGQGLLIKVAEMMNCSISSFRYKGLKVRSDHEVVIYWIITSEAKLDRLSENVIEVVLGLACSPNEIKGRVKLTKKEAEIASELQKMWDNNSKYGCFFDSDKFKKKAEELSALTHHLECYREFYFDFGMDDFYQKIDLLSQTYVFDGLTDNAIEASTRDLIPVKELFGKTE